METKDNVFVVPVIPPGPHIPEFGMPPGVRGCGKDTIGYQLMGFSPGGRCTFMGWVYPTEAEAQKARRAQLRGRKLRKSSRRPRTSESGG